MSRHRNPKTHNERTFAKTNAISCKSAHFNWTFERALKLASSSFSSIEHICFESSKVQSEPVGGKECVFEGPRLRHREPCFLNRFLLHCYSMGEIATVRSTKKTQRLQHSDAVVGPSPGSSWALHLQIWGGIPGIMLCLVVVIDPSEK